MLKTRSHENTAATSPGSRLRLTIRLSQDPYLQIWILKVGLLLLLLLHALWLGYLISVEHHLDLHLYTFGVVAITTGLICLGGWYLAASSAGLARLLEKRDSLRPEPLPVDDESLLDEHFQLISERHVRPLSTDETDRLQAINASLEATETGWAGEFDEDGAGTRARRLDASLGRLEQYIGSLKRRAS